MANKEVIEIARENLDKVFKKTRREVENIGNILDVSPRTLKRILKDDSKVRALRKELVNKLGHPYLGAEDNFLALTSKQKLATAEHIISKYTDTKAEDTLLNSRSSAREKVILKRSRAAGARLKDNVINYLDSMELITASPKLRSKLFTDARNKKDKLSLTIELPMGRRYKKAEALAVEALSSAYTHRSNKDTDLLMNTKVQGVGQLYEKGKNSVRQLRKKKVLAGKRNKRLKQDYFVPGFLAGEDQRDASHVSIRATLEVLLSERVGEKPHMQPKGTRTDKRWLVWQTGRFARSAKITSVDTNINIGFDYMRDPYSTFENEMPGRDPRNIIEGAIRSIMMEHYRDVRVGSIYMV